MEMKFDSDSEVPRHVCISQRSGEWAVFTCPHCPDFERRMNLRTGAMRVRGSEFSAVLHEGIYLPVGLEQTYSLSN